MMTMGRLTKHLVLKGTVGEKGGFCACIYLFALVYFGHIVHEPPTEELESFVIETDSHFREELGMVVVS